MKRTSCMYLSEAQVKESYSDFSENNDYIVETAGFIPLDVRFKQLEEGGLIAQYQRGDFTSADYRQAYLTPDFEITPEDDFEEIQEKLAARQKFFEEIKAKSDGINDKAGTVEPEEKKAADAAEEVKPEE